MLDMELQVLVFYLGCLCLSWIQTFLGMSPFLPLGTGMFVLYHCLLEACKLMFKRLPEPQKSLCTPHLNPYGTTKDYRNFFFLVF